MNKNEMETTARALVAPGKGILAADESLPTIEKRFKSIGVPSTEENRRAYRELLFKTPGLGEFISGVILFDETVRQNATDGTTLVEVLKPIFDSGKSLVPPGKVVTKTRFGCWHYIFCFSAISRS